MIAKNTAVALKSVLRNFTKFNLIDVNLPFLKSRKFTIGQTDGRLDLTKLTHLMVLLNFNK
jgi:hypothetical protein